MATKTRLRNNFPNNINKAGEIFSALIANDNGNAAIESVLDELEEYMASWSESKSVYDMTGSQLDKTLKFLSFIERFTGESDESLLGRIHAIFVRQGDTKWGSVGNIRHVFSSYFPTSDIHIVENSVDSDESLILNGDFTNDSEWTFTGSELSVSARWSGSQGVSLPSASTASQSITLEDGTYFIHAFTKGDVSITVEDGNGNYWSDSAKAWTTENITNENSSSDWQNSTIWFILDESATVTITLLGGENGGMADFVRLFLKDYTPCFTILVHFDANLNNTKALTLFRGDDDPVDESTETEYSNASYLDHTFFTGVAAGFAIDLYNDLLEYVRAVGVKANLEIVTRDYIEEE